MIKQLNGAKEIINYDTSNTLMLYDNEECEEYPFHWHTAVEIIMPVKNTYHIEMNAGIHHILQEEDIILLRPGALHKLHAQEGSRIIFQIDFNILSALDSFDDYFPGNSQSILITPSSNPEIHKECAMLLREIKEDYSSNEPLKDASAYSKVLKMLVLIKRNMVISNEIFTSSNHTKQKEYIDKFVKITDYIKQHCNEDIDLDMIAEMSGFSKYHFSRLFKEFAGVSYYKYVNQKRIEYAEVLLIDPETNITDVAIHSGFNSVSSFIRMFKQLKGCTPTEFRNMQRVGKK